MLNQTYFRLHYSSWAFRIVIANVVGDPFGWYSSIVGRQMALVGPELGYGGSVLARHVRLQVVEGDQDLVLNYL